MINNLIGKIKVFDDKEALRKTLKKAKKNNWSRCPRCGQIVEREVYITIFNKSNTIDTSVGWMCSYNMLLRDLFVSKIKRKKSVLIKKKKLTRNLS